MALLTFAGMACSGSATPVSRIVGRSVPIWLGSTSRMVVAVIVLAPTVAVYRLAITTWAGDGVDDH